MKPNNLDITMWEQAFGGTVDSDGNLRDPMGRIHINEVAFFSSDIKCAWHIVNAMKKNGYKLYLAESLEEDGVYMCSFTHKNKHASKAQDFTEGKNVCEVICYAALEILKTKTKRFQRRKI